MAWKAVRKVDIGEAEKTLYKEWRRLSAFCTLTLPCMAFLLYWAAQNPDFSARRWLLMAALTVAGEFWFLRRVLHQNHPPNAQELYPDLGVANLLTIGRGLGYAWMAGFLFMPRPGGWVNWLPALLYLLASLSDYVDGYLARRTARVSRLGETLDIEYDGLGMLVAIALAVQYGQLPAVFLLLGMARPLFAWGMLLRARMGLPNHPLTESNQRRIMAGLLIGFMVIVLWPIFNPPATSLAGAIFAGMIVLGFIRDWLVVIGRLQPQHPAYQRWRARLKSFVFGWLPCGLRLLLAVVVAFFIVDIGQGRSLAGIPAIVRWFFVIIGAGSGLLALFGIAARVAAILIIVVACADFVLGSHTWLNLSLLALASLLVVVGNGYFARWTPEERWLRRKYQ